MPAESRISRTSWLENALIENDLADPGSAETDISMRGKNPGKDIAGGFAPFIRDTREGEMRREAGFTAVGC